MYDIACRCRDPYIRRRAVNVLRIAARQEGIYSSSLAATIAESVIAIEEASVPSVKACGDVPYYARIVQVGRFFDREQRKATLYYQHDKSPIAPTQEQIFKSVIF